MPRTSGRAPSRTARASQKPRRRAPLRSWEPYARGAPGALWLIEAVGYDGVVVANELYFGPNLAAFGAFAKRHTPTIEQHFPSWYVPTARLCSFAKRHRFELYDDAEDSYVEPSTRAVKRALQGESDLFVARLLGDHDADRDVEGAYSSIVRVKPSHFVGLAAQGRRAWFAPVLSRSAKVFEVCVSHGFLDAHTSFVRAATRADVFAAVFHDRKHPLHERAVAAVCSRDAYAAGELDDDPRARPAQLARMSPDALCAMLDYCYDKSCFVSLSVREAHAPYVFGEAPVAHA